MARIDKLLIKLRHSPQNVSFDELAAICAHYFGPPRTAGSHVIYTTPWAGDPRINIQRQTGGGVKLYQLRQVLRAIERLQTGE